MQTHTHTVISPPLAAGKLAVLKVDHNKPESRLRVWTTEM